MFWPKKNVISTQVINYKTSKIMKSVMRDARKRIRKGELRDSHSLELYLQTIDSRYMQVVAEIRNSTLVENYNDVRANKLAETRELLAFFDRDCEELDNLRKIVAKKAEESGKMDDFKHEQLASIDLSKLTSSFNNLELKPN